MSNNNDGQRMKAVNPQQPDPIRLVPTDQLLNEIKRRSIGCLLVALVIDDGGLARWVVNSKGTGDVLKDVCTAADLEKIQRLSALREDL